jgi:hypothetical protein
MRQPVRAPARAGRHSLSDLSRYFKIQPAAPSKSIYIVKSQLKFADLSARSEFTRSVEMGTE